MYCLNSMICQNNQGGRKEERKGGGRQEEEDNLKVEENAEGKKKEEIAHGPKLWQDRFSFWLLGPTVPVSLLKATVPNKTWPFKALNYVSAELLKSA